MADPQKSNTQPAEQSWLAGLATAVIIAAVLLLLATAVGFLLWVMFR